MVVGRTRSISGRTREIRKKKVDQDRPARRLENGDTGSKSRSKVFQKVEERGSSHRRVQLLALSSDQHATKSFRRQRPPEQQQRQQQQLVLLFVVSSAAASLPSSSASPPTCSFPAAAKTSSLSAGDAAFLRQAEEGGRPSRPCRSRAADRRC